MELQLPILPSFSVSGCSDVLIFISDFVLRGLSIPYAQLPMFI